MSSRAADATVFRRRAWVSLVVLVFDGAALAATATNVNGPLRFCLGVIFGLLVPGWTVVGFLALGNAALELALTIGLSLSIVMVLAQVMMTAGLWHPLALQELVGTACAPALIVSVVRNVERSVLG